MGRQLLDLSGPYIPIVLRVMAIGKVLGAVTFKGTYSGSDDSPSGAEFRFLTGHAEDEVELSADFEESLSESIRRLCYHVAEMVAPGWYNNEGANGEVIINIATGKITHSHVPQRYTDVVGDDGDRVDDVDRAQQHTGLLKRMLQP